MNDYSVHDRTQAEQPAVVVETTLAEPEIAAWLGKAYASVAAFLASQDARPAGPPFARYHRLGDGRFQIEAGFPINALTQPSGETQHALLPGGTAAVTVHVGPYDAMEPAYVAIDAWIRERGGEPQGDPWEIYLTDPSRQPDPATWRTEVVQPYRRPAG